MLNQKPLLFPFLFPIKKIFSYTNQQKTHKKIASEKRLTIKDPSCYKNHLYFRKNNFRKQLKLYENLKIFFGINS